MIIESSAPTRIDLAGGTLDIWPLYLFHNNARTINIAIDQLAKVRIETQSGNAIEIYSKDLDRNLKLTSIDYIDEVELDDPLIFLIRLLAFFAPSGGLKITTSCMSPTGAGLGGSSALGIAFAGALNYLTGNHYSREEIILIVKNIETQVLKVPSGVQDYYPAMYGGLNSVMLGVTGEKLMRHSNLLIRKLESQLVLVSSGKPHHSGMNNWKVYKSYLDEEEKVQTAFEGIQTAATEMEHSLKLGDFNGIAQSIEKDMSHRKELSSDIFTEDLEKLIELGKNAGAKAAKICGAGGGGCIMFWVPQANKAKFIREITDNDAKVINFHVVTEGLNVNAN